MLARGTATLEIEWLLGFVPVFVELCVIHDEVLFIDVFVFGGLSGFADDGRLIIGLNQNRVALT